MTPSNLHKRVWERVRTQHGVVSRRQLIELGFTAEAIRWRVAKGRLHLVHRGVYAAGRPELTMAGHFMAAVLACGPGAVLSHASAALLWRILALPRNWKGPAPPTPIHVSLHAAVVRRLPGIRVHRRRSLTDSDLTTHLGIPVTTPTRTLIDRDTYRMTESEVERRFLWIVRKAGLPRRVGTK